MRNLKTLISLLALSVALIAVPTAAAKLRTVGSSSGNPTMNECAASIDCTYINFHNGKPTDVVKKNGTVTSWSLNAASTGGQVQLRILRPAAGGQFKAIRSSGLETVSGTGVNTFTTHLKVRRGDVLALSNDSSGLYMEAAPANTCVRFFNSPFGDGSTGTPSQNVSELHLLLSAQVRS